MVEGGGKKHISASFPPPSRLRPCYLKRRRWGFPRRRRLPGDMPCRNRLVFPHEHTQGVAQVIAARPGVEAALALGVQLVKTAPVVACRFEETVLRRQCCSSVPHLVRGLDLGIGRSCRMIERVARPKHRIHPQRTRQIRSRHLHVQKNGGGLNYSRLPCAFDNADCRSATPLSWELLAVVNYSLMRESLQTI